MNEQQRAVITRVDADIAKAMKPYNMRMALYHRINLLDDERLVRLLAVAQKLTPDELDAALGYAEGLAAWRWVGEESDDASLSKGRTETSTG